MSNYCKNCYELTEELENHKRWINDYKQKLQDAEEFANAKITQCANLIKQLNETHEQLEAYKMEAEEGKEINAELKATNEGLLSIQYKLADNNKRLRQTLSEIKELFLKTPTDSQEYCVNAKSVILQKISEVEDV